MQLVDKSVNLTGALSTAWHKLVDWRTMTDWDPFIDWVRFDGPLHIGSVGRLKLKGGPRVDLVVTAFEEPYIYTNEFTLLASKFIFYHYLSELQPGTIVLRIMVESHGLSALLLAPYMAKSFSEKMPQLMAAFKQQYESGSAGIF